MSHTLSEYESKQLLRTYGVPTVSEALAADANAAAARAVEIGVPAVLKLCGAAIAHKTERDLVRLNLADVDAVRAAAAELLGRKRSEDGDAQLLVQAMVRGRREIIVGLVRDAQFGPCVMLGMGGILAEAMRDVVFRMAPLTHGDALDMLTEIKAAHLLDAFRGEPAVDRDALARILIAVGQIGTDRADVLSLDINPLIIHGAQPIAVDALVELADG
ncbi:MAG TPA: acetate--CoA ligase family protein [Candidatus Binatia bacterium]|nr:acetate--CoA ligase family protein [Candidatus Binatia bacterium]